MPDLARVAGSWLLMGRWLLLGIVCTWRPLGTANGFLIDGWLLLDSFHHHDVLLIDGWLLLDSLHHHCDICGNWW